MAIDPNDHRPPFRQIADALRTQIASGVYPPGGRLPSNRALMDEYDVASQTVQNAIKELRVEGIVRSVQGRANFVVDDLDVSKVKSHGAASEDYQLLRDYVDRLAVEMDEIRQQLGEIVRRLPSEGPQEAKPAPKRSASEPR